MGQYHYVCNLDKREFLHPHRFNEGLQLMEFGCSANGTLTGLTLLLSASNGRGGGDFRGEAPEIVGRWVGDRIAIIGDYHVPQDVPGFTDKQDIPWEEGTNWTDISIQVREAARLDEYVAQSLPAHGFGES